MRATIKKLGRSAGWHCGDKSDDIIDIVTFGQRGRKPRHLSPIKIIGVGTANALEIALIGRLKVPVIHARECRRAERIIAESITRMASTADIDVIILSP